jgi:hypothetical protein
MDDLSTIPTPDVDEFDKSQDHLTDNKAYWKSIDFARTLSQKLTVAKRLLVEQVKGCVACYGTGIYTTLFREHACPYCKEARDALELINKP